VVQNILLLVDATIMPAVHGHEMDAEMIETMGASSVKAWNVGYTTVRIVLASLQITTCSLAVLVTFVRSTFLHNLRLFRDMSGLDVRQTMALWRRPCTNARLVLAFLSTTAYAIAVDVTLMVRLAFVAFAVCGAIVYRGERFFIIHLIQVVLQNKGLMDVLRAVTQNGKQLMLTLMLLTIVIWMFAVIGTEMEYAMITEDGADRTLCTTPGHCWLEIVNSLATGDVGDLLMHRPRSHSHTDWHTYLAVWSYQFLLFVIVVIILLNVVFGIIIDTFSELRGEKAAKKNHMENTCFICGVDRFTFDTKGDGFAPHVARDHNMWTYLAMMIHVREKEPTEYNGWETYVAERMEAKDTSFMPRNNALVLQASQIAEEAATEELHRRVGEVETQNRTMLTMLEALQRDSAAILERLHERPAHPARVSSVGGLERQTTMLDLK